MTIWSARARIGCRRCSHGVAALGFGVLVACGDAAQDARPAVTTTDSVAHGSAADTGRASVESAAWSLRPPVQQLRAYAWGAGDTLWGIVRGRLAAAAADGTVRRLEPVAWDVRGSAAGVVSWTGEAGLLVRDGTGVDTVRRAAGIGDDHTGPEVLWSPSGRSALLTWIGEAGTRHSLLEGAEHRLLTARLAGYMSGAPVLWLDETRAVLPVTAIAGRTGPAEHREAGYRIDIAVLDVAADSIRRVTDAADGEFLVIEGLLHPDTILVGARAGSDLPARHLALDTRAWRLSPRLDARGRAMAGHGAIALLRADPADTRRTDWDLVLLEGGAAPHAIRSLSGHEIRLLWHPARPVLAVSQESEAPGGTVTFVVERRPRR